jgi:hypothetical protein
MPAILLLLQPYLDVILALALAWLSLKIVQALFGPLAGIPAIGSAIVKLEKVIARSIANACGSIASGVDHVVGGSLHSIARLSDAIAGKVRQHANLLLGIASFLPPLAIAVSGIRALVRSIHTTSTHQGARIKKLEREYHGIEHQVKVLEREFKGIDETGIRSQLKALDKEIAAIETQTIPAIRSRVAADEGAFAGLESWLGIKAGVNYKAWSIALATTLLGALGLGGLRCSNFGRLLNKWGCGLGTLLDDLIGLALSALALEAVCEFLPLIEAAFGAIAGPMVHLLNEVPLGACEKPPPGWANLSVAAGPLPPAQTLGTLPS